MKKSVICTYILLQMGGQESKDILSDDYYLLEHLSKMSLQNRKSVSYYFITPDNSSDFNNLLNELRQYFKLEHFPTIKTLKQEMSFVGKLELVKVIITNKITNQDLSYLQNQSKISQLIAYQSSPKGEKIAGAASNNQQLIKLLNSLQERDGLEIPASNVLFMIDQDTKILNKYRLNYHCNTTFNDRAAAKKDFIILARSLMPQQFAIIDQFENKYDLSLQGEAKRKMVLNWAFQNSFYWQLLSGLTRNTTDPKRLSYLRLPIKDLYESVKEQYRANKLFETFYVVIQLNQEEKNKLQRIEDAVQADQREKHFMLFSSFMKGTTDQKESVVLLKNNPNNYRFLVNIYKKEKPQNLDFGYVKSGNQVIVNLYNVFQIDSIKNKSRRNQLLYGVLPIMDQCRQVQQGRNKMTKSELNLTRNYDYLQDLMGKIDSQATVLQLSGYFKESLEIYDKKVDFIRKSNESDENMNRCLIKKADALTLNGEYQAAEREYLEVSKKSEKIKAISLIHLTELYTRIGEDVKVDKTVDEFQPMLPILQKDQKEAEQFFKGSHFLALRTLKKGSARKAEELLKKILNSASTYYKHNLEGKPIVHDLYRSLAAAVSKQGRHSQALQLLNETRMLQLVCEGKTHNLALTETLIQSVSKSSGNKEELSKSLKRMELLSTEIGASEHRLQSSAMIGLNQSMVKIDV